MQEPVYQLPFVYTPHIVRRPAPTHRGTYRRHCIDWEMPQGTPILAAREGIVIRCIDTYRRTYTNPQFWERVNCVVIRHFGGETTSYWRLQYGSALVRVGDRVDTGQCIALSGQTGCARYPHLHFGIFDAENNSLPVQPLTVPEFPQAFVTHRFRRSART